MKTVLWNVRDGIGTMTLNRPEALNALNPEMMAEIRQVVSSASDDPAVKALIVAGGEKAFCAGADLKYLSEILDDHAKYFAFVEELQDLLFLIEEAPLPTIAMLRGFVLAGGLELTLSCDFAIASTDAQIGDQHSNYGLLPGGGSTQRLVRRVGHQRGKELLFAGNWVDGSRAEEIGLVLKAVPQADLEAETRAFASQMVSKSKKNLGYIKRAVLRGADLPMHQAMTQETHALFEYFTSSPSPQEGLSAFRDRREPDFPE